MSSIHFALNGMEEYQDSGGIPTARINCTAFNAR